MTSIHVPPSTSMVTVQIIDTTGSILGLWANQFWGPDLEGFSTFGASILAFLITHTDPSTQSQRKYLFDLGAQRDWENDLAPGMVEMLRTWHTLGARIKIEKYVSEVLEDNGVALDSIEGAIWSHAHFDHVGRMGLFPTSTKLLVGNGVKEALYPGFPENPESHILARDFAGREVIEMDFSTSDLKIGSFSAIDYFADGSFYLLSAPGHATGHLNALARTGTTPEGESTFILMTADSYHHVSMLRPSQHLHLPKSIQLPEFVPCPCPGELFHTLHPSHPTRKTQTPTRYESYLEQHHSDADTSPFFTIVEQEDGSSLAINIDDARTTIRALQDFDADPNIFLIAAHDTSLIGVVDLFPKKANEWKQKGWKDAGRWRFLQSLQQSLNIIQNKE